jgi:hypothetical protein
VVARPFIDFHHPGSNDTSILAFLKKKESFLKIFFDFFKFLRKFFLKVFTSCITRRTHRQQRLGEARNAAASAGCRAVACVHALS